VLFLTLGNNLSVRFVRNPIRMYFVLMVVNIALLMSKYLKIKHLFGLNH